MKRLILLVLLAALPIAAATIPITSTGGEAPGSVDLDWKVNGGNVYVTTGGFPFGAWFANDAASSWISPQPSYAAGQTDAPGNYDYTTTFDLTGLAPSTASIDFLVSVDNALVDVLINGTSTGYAFAGFGGFSGSFNINSGFIAGLNTITFQTTNAAGATGNPAGLRVYFTSATADTTPAVPEPGSLSLLAIGAVLFASRRLRRKS